MTHARVVSVNLAVVRAESWAGDKGRTGIDKRPTTERATARRLGMDGDTICDTKNHGGVHQALYAYAAEDAAWWANALSRDVVPGNFGENLTTEGIDLTNAVIGERWAVGDAVLEVSVPRIPCRVFAGFWDVKDLIKRFTARAHPGAYLRVLTEGTIGAGDPIEVVHRPAHGVTIGEVFRALTTESELLPRLLDAPELPEETLEGVRRRLGLTTAASDTPSHL
ncbi:MAG: MOSC domain-containing protein [Micromonosporaceae bacterium]